MPKVVEGLGSRHRFDDRSHQVYQGLQGESGYRSPDSAVAEINAALAKRDPSKPKPVVAAGDMVRHP